MRDLNLKSVLGWVILHHMVKNIDLVRLKAEIGSRIALIKFACANGPFKEFMCGNGRRLEVVTCSVHIFAYCVSLRTMG